MQEDRHSLDREKRRLKKRLGMRVSGRSIKSALLNAIRKRQRPRQSSS